MAMAQSVGRVARLWYGGVKKLGIHEISLREMLGLRRKQATVIAVGGNSLDGAERQTAENIVEFRAPVISHGNGPQVGKVSASHPDWPLWKCVEETQKGPAQLAPGEDSKPYHIGVTLTKALKEAADRKGRALEVLVVPTRVLVEIKDPAFSNPTKAIGSYYSEAEMQEMGELEHKGEGWFYSAAKDWHIKKVGNPNDASRPWRRVVASPKPLAIHPEDLKAIIDGISAGKTVVACGGGGVPGYMNQRGQFVPIDAVIDKDFASALLAIALKAREMIISTGVKKVAHGFGTPEQENISYYMAADAIQGIKAGQYKVGQMKEKVEAAISALRGRVNVVAITEPETNWHNMVVTPFNAEGTLITRGPDPIGKLLGIGKTLGNIAEYLFGRRFFFPDRLERWAIRQ